jgi:ribosomal protein L16 Arg81 hydroxylase
MPHTHPDKDVLLYYCNVRWNTEWAGETIIYSDNDSEAEHAISYRPGRVLWLPKGVMHSVRPPSNACPEYRFTFAAMFQA